MTWVAHESVWRGPGGQSVPYDGEEPEPHRMLVGAALGLPLAGRGQAYGHQYNADVGPIGIVRSYDPGLSATVGGANEQFAVDIGVDLNLSIKPGGESTTTYESIAAGDWDTAIQNYANSWPASIGGYLTIGNEPDQNSKEIEPEAFCAAVEHLASALTLPANVRLAVALMTWSWTPGNPRLYGDRWIPDVPGLHVGIHGYGRDNYEHASSLFGKVVQDIPEGYTWGVGETNAHESATDPDAKANWFIESAQWCYENKATHYILFDTGTGPISGEHNITRSSPQATAAAKHLAETYN